MNELAVSPRSGPRLTQAERSAKARASLLDAAIVLIAERGYAQATTVEIAKAAGMTRGAIQHHFSGRDDLVLAILHELEERVRTSFRNGPVQAPVPLEVRVDQLIDHFGTVALSPAYMAVVDIWMSTRAEPDLRDAVRKSMMRSSASYRQLWQDAFGKDAPASVVSECRRVVVCQRHHPRAALRHRGQLSGGARHGVVAAVAARRDPGAGQRHRT